MSEKGYGTSGGAVDLSQVGVPQAQPDPAAATLPPEQAGAFVDAPLVVEVTTENIEVEMALSATVPVILMLVSKNSIASKQALEVMSKLVRRDSGAFQLATVDVEANPQLAAAFQATAVPATFALVAGRPAPLFEGVPTEAQAESLLAEILQVAPQLGVTGRIRVSEADLETPTPKEHLPAREAEEVGDWDRAVKAWKKVLANNPSDREATTALARAQFEARYESELADAPKSEDADSPSVLADKFFAQGQEKQAFDILLDALVGTSDKDEKEALRKQLVGLFPIAVDGAAVKAARGRLATHLMV